MPTEAEFEALKRTVQDLKDRHDILECITRECRARDRQGRGADRRLLVDDGVDEHGPHMTKAVDHPARANAGTAPISISPVITSPTTCSEIDGDTAYSESYNIGGLYWLDGKTTTIAMGRYIDQLERRNGQWRLLKRRCTIEVTADADGTWVHSKFVKGFLKGLWSKDDPSYERPVVLRPKTEGVRW